MIFMVTKKALLRAFWNCGDSQVIEFAISRARLNKREEQVVRMAMDECMTQEWIAEQLDVSVRHIQTLWDSALKKLLGIPWVMAYSLSLCGFSEASQ